MIYLYMYLFIAAGVWVLYSLVDPYKEGYAMSTLEGFFAGLFWLPALIIRGIVD